MCHFRFVWNDEERRRLKKLAENLRRIRLEKNISQIALEVKADISKNIVGQIERTEVNPTFLTLVRISSALEVSLDVLTQ